MGPLRPRRPARRLSQVESTGWASTALDLYLIHWPDDDVPLESTVSAMLQLMDGASSARVGRRQLLRPSQRARVTFGVPVTSQVELHPWFPQEPLDRTCRAHRIPVTAYSPLAKGRAANDPLLRGIGARHDATAVQAALRWSTRRGHIVIPKSARRDRLRENVGAFDFDLNDADGERDFRPADGSAHRRRGVGRMGRRLIA